MRDHAAASVANPKIQAFSSHCITCFHAHYRHNHVVMQGLKERFSLQSEGREFFRELDESLYRYLLENQRACKGKTVETILKKLLSDEVLSGRVEQVLSYSTDLFYKHLRVDVSLGEEEQALYEKLSSFWKCLTQRTPFSYKTPGADLAMVRGGLRDFFLTPDMEFTESPAQQLESYLDARFHVAEAQAGMQQVFLEQKKRGFAEAVAPSVKAEEGKPSAKEAGSSAKRSRTGAAAAIKRSCSSVHGLNKRGEEEWAKQVAEEEQSSAAAKR